MTRIAVIAASLAFSAVASADRLITVPTARKIPVGFGRYEFRGVPKSGGAHESLIGVGLTTLYEMELRTSSLDGGGERGTFDLAYNVIAPIPELAPGISFGIQDVLGRTQDHRRYYAAVTYRPYVLTANGEMPADVTIGMIQGPYLHPFVGVMLPLAHELRLLVEHNGYRGAAGVEYRPRANFALRWQFRDRQNMASVQYTFHF